ncbi:unnamed protein product [Microthlaspi erraticum]|uniref:Zinc knuckle CX2CX4HX4C domain-containing protein n=1 Tax=Microthlaspi erraticum TaxID=1685480 RepID=A0A6D2K0H9_9BRAS|nr:unnamed protein product [Microthlaspi erraticum]
METVLRNGLWAFAERMVVLQRWTPYMMPDMLNFIPFWIQIRGIPLQFMNQDVIAHIGRAMGLLMDVDYNAEAIARGINTLLKFRYERLRGFCEVCGMLSHDSGACLIRNGGPDPHSDDENEEPDHSDSEEHDRRGLPNGGMGLEILPHNAGVVANGNPGPVGARIEEIVEEDEVAPDGEESEDVESFHSEEMDSDGCFPGEMKTDEAEERDAKEKELRNAVTPVQESLKRKFEDDPKSGEESFTRMERGQSSGVVKKRAANKEGVCGEVGPEPPLAP